VFYPREAAWLVLGVVAVVAAVADDAVERTIAFACDGGALERAYLVEAAPDRINYTIPHLGPFRWTEQGWRVVYAFPLAGAQTAQLELKCANRFAFAVSGDRQDWRVVLREDRPASGLGNLARRTVDLTPYLGPETLYLKLEHSLPEHAGFGGCLFDMKLTYRQPDQAVPLVTAGRAARAPVIDADLKDDVWRTAQALTPFWPIGGRRPAGQKTVARVAWDAGALYAAFVCAEERPEAIVSITTQRDGEVFRDTAVELFVQPAEAEHYYHFALNTLGTKFDEIAKVDLGWDPSWEGAAKVVEGGYRVEMRIPFASLDAAPPQAGDTWRLNLCRTGTSDGELSSWSPLEGGFHRPDRFGLLRFAEAAPPALGLTWSETWGDHPLPTLGNVAPLFEGGAVLLDVFPEAGNALRRQTVIADGRFGFQGRLPEYGRGRMTFSLCDAAGAVVHRLAAAYAWPEPSPEPLVATLKQPYYTDEPAIQARIETNTEDPGAVVVTLTSGGAVLAEKKLDGTDAEVAFDLAGLPLGDYELVFTLFGKGGETVAVERRDVHRLSPDVAPSRVEIRDGGVCYVNGGAFFPVIFFLAGGNEIVARAANTVVGGGEDPAGCAALLDGAQQHGLMAMPHLCNLLRGNNDWDGLRATVSRNKNHPALLSWYLGDEPEGSGDVPDLLLEARAIIRAIDRHHPISVLNNTPTVFAAYAPTCDVHMADPYPIPRQPVTLVAEWADISRRAAGPGRPTWLCLQTHNLALYGMDDGRWPTPDELRCMMYLALTHGSRGIAWWCYNHARDSGNWTAYETMYRELQQLAPYLLETAPGGAAVRVEPDRLHVSAHARGGRCLVLTANPGGAVDATFTVSGITPAKALRVHDGVEFALTGGAFIAPIPTMGAAAFLLE